METRTMDEALKAIHEILQFYSEEDQNQLLKSVKEHLTYSRDKRIKELQEQSKDMQEQIDQLKDSMDQL